MGTRRFRPTPDQVPTARHFVLESVGALEPSFDRHVREDLALLTTEAVANAVEHAGTWIDVTVVQVEPTSYRVSVHDESPEPVPPPAPLGSMTSTAGRGLAIIDAVAATWGVEDEQGTGKTIWFVTTAH